MGKHNNHDAATATASASATTTTVNDDQGGTPKLSTLIRQDLTFMTDTIAEVEKYVDHVKVQINQARDTFDRLEARGSYGELYELKKIAAKLKAQVPSDVENHPADGTASSSSNHYKLQELETRGNDRELHELKKTIAKLKSQIASNLKTRPTDSNPRRGIGADGFDNSSNQADVNKARHGSIPNLYEDPKFEHPTAFEHLKVSFLGLPLTLRLCLLCFLRFPEKATLKRTLVIYWWIGEGVLPPILMDLHTEEEDVVSQKTAEDFGNQFLDDLTEKGFIEPVYSKSSSAADSCSMRPLVRSVLTSIAEKVGFSGIYTVGDPNSQTLGPSGSRCLLNVGASIVDGGPELFSKMKHIEILYLGRWQSSATHHIELGDTGILNELKHMNQLRFLSLRGISMITQLPRFISQLKNMKILDVRACHNLEIVPDEIGLLQNLTHLDMSECYFLERMPKGLALLRNLQILKGFFVGDSKYNKRSCTLDDLANIPKLRKLNIYTSVNEFPTEVHLRALEQLGALEKLTISWGGCSGKVNNLESLEESNHGGPTLPSTLQKLDLQCFRRTITPTWLRPANLKNLKKLYIRGGKFRDLGQFQEEDLWSVEILRLKYLNELEMDWMDLRRLFPALIYLEKVKCPRLYMFLCDKNGVWMNRTKKSNQL